MKKLEINSDAVISAFKKANPETKKILKNLFEGVLPLSESITSFETACTFLNISTKLPKVEGLRGKDAKHIIVEYKLIIITEALNEGWTPDWNNFNQCKWFVYFLGGYAYDGASAGLGYSYSDYSVAGAAAIGSRLCYKSKELAEYSRTQFEDLWLDYFRA